jgi:hypothetical protein
MPPPTQNHIDEMGPEVYPFERKNFSNQLQPGEDIIFSELIFDATEGGIPTNAIIVNRDSIDQNPSYGRYLWIIDKRGLWILLETTENFKASRGHVCHTNITGGKQALQGGELWFEGENKISINFYSGRYGGTTTNHWIAVVKYFKSLNYIVNVVL